MDLNALNMFVMAVRSGSLTAAARENNIPLPTLSRRIQDLEKELKVLLLERTAKGCKVTEAGKKLLNHASSAMDILNDAEQFMVPDHPHITGRLRLTLPQSMGPWWEIIRQFQQTYPRIAVNVYSTERRVDLISDGVDVALRVGTIADDSVVARHLMDFRHILVASPRLLNASPPLREPSDLIKFPCAAWGSIIDARPVWMLGNHAYDVSAVLTVNDYLHLRAGALAGDFITELPAFFAAEYIKRGELTELLPEYPLPYSSLHLVYKKQQHISSTARAYIDFCTAHIAELSEQCHVPPDAHYKEE
ncbi:LysR family transcriptional regulator [Pectobacterium carotovorum]|uniref:LysR family transcriptional regulator n=1 Tax=Pectobacterium carotovorum TaxID=554 RepID=UPI001F114F89|nr:LysR family transcriptional regulator [Pectobacterium carotovorum]MCH4996183.1 LysR family transcriptional regulator [Pectobacterium carotovorum]WDG00309.1 LysR substrate-binding domain-containing protein [Pectobacterium carotovorum subsp. carotovorum]